MSRKSLAFAIALSFTALSQPAYARDEEAWDDAGTVARNVLVVAALAVPAVKGDWKGDLQAAASMGAASLFSTGLKEAFPSWRPDRSDRKSFPSGHASVSFAAAATLHNRYGWKVGLPAQVAATFVGVSRIQARKHHWYDVVAGAAIGETAGFLITSKRNGNVQVLPWGDSKGAGLTLAMRF